MCLRRHDRSGVDVECAKYRGSKKYRSAELPKALMGPARPGLLGANEKGCFRRYGGAASGFDAFVSDRLPAHAASIVSWYARRRTRTRDPLSDHPPPARPKTPPGASPRGLARAPADTANSVGYGSGITERYKRRW